MVTISGFGIGSWSKWPSPTLTILTTSCEINTETHLNNQPTASLLAQSTGLLGKSYTTTPPVFRCFPAFAPDSGLLVANLDTNLPELAAQYRNLWADFMESGLTLTEDNILSLLIQTSIPHSTDLCNEFDN
ncbi:hypothetical protein PSHT_04580 [Puccinia striiformis]|uniref:Uncharacterized protein n=1 Tax=Puccinia striiformis TaxID=27350 RepID=A0A2S4WCP9_9BASI|nr:hypothetical protein PSHT_04580 [Puccinia striiformis]